MKLPGLEPVLYVYETIFLVHNAHDKSPFQSEKTEPLRG